MIKDSSPASSPSRLVYLLCGILIAVTFAFHLGSAAVGFPAFRDQHLGGALDYARNGVDWLHPMIVGFNANEVATPQEFPIWQAFAGWLLRAGGEWWGMANLASLLFFLVGYYALFRLASDLWGRSVAQWVLLAWLAQPLVFIYAGVAGTDGASISAMILFIWLAHRAVQSFKSKDIVLAACSGALCATLKMPFFFCAGLFLMAWWWTRFRFSWKPWAVLIGVGAFSSVVFLLWTNHCNSVLAQAQYPFVELRISQNPAMKTWYFGNMAYRLNPAVWIKGGWRFLNSIFGSIAIAALIPAALFRKRARVPLLWGLAALATVLVFTKIVLQHSHYYLMFSPAVAILMGSLLHDSNERLSVSTQRLLFSLMVMAGIGLAQLQGFQGMNRQLQFDPYYRVVAKIIAEHTDPSDRLLIQGGGWGGKMLILSDRRGYTIDSVSMAFENLGGIDEASRAGFTKLVFVSPESPLLRAVQVANSGKASKIGREYKGADDEPASGWETLYRDELLCIKVIPESNDGESEDEQLP